MRGDLGTLLAMKAASLRGGLASEWSDNRLKLLAGGVTVLLVVPGVYLLFDFLFGYIYGLESTFPGFGEALSRRLLHMTLLSFGVFIAISSFISGFAVLFRSGETGFLLTLPVADRDVAVFRTAESWLYAGWASVLLGLPVVVAFVLSLGLGTAATVTSVVLFLPMVVTWVAAGSVLLALAVRIGGEGGLWRSTILLALLVGAAIALVLSGSGPSSILATDSSSLEAIHRFVAGLPTAGGFLWPHSLYGEAMLLASEGSVGALAPAGLLLLQVLLLGGIALALLAGGFRRRFAAVSAVRSRSRTSRLMLRRGSRMRAMYEKDLLLFVRDPVQWSQLALLAGLFLLYAANLGRFPMDIGHPLWSTVLAYLNFAFSCFVTATLLVRFTFPAVSLEADGLPYLLQLPRGRSLMMRAKWNEAAGLILPLMLGTGLYTTVTIGAGPVTAVSTTMALLLMCLALVSINVGLGAVFPRFRKGSGASIASGQGGIIAAFASMGYVLLAVTVLGGVVRTGFPAAGTETYMVRPMAWALLFLVVVTAGVSTLSMGLSLRSFERRDF